MRTFSWLIILVAVFASQGDGVVGKIRAEDERDAIRKSVEKALEKVDPHCIPADARDTQRTMMSRYLRAGISKANAASTDEWNRIQSRDDWERFRHSKLELLAKSLSRQPFVPGKPQILVSGSVRGEGFRIENLVIQPPGRTVITANFYRPDPPRESMPGILLSHCHHNPKYEGELQDMGMTWARAGCCVLVPDQLGHGERRQHPFHSAADYAGEFAVGRQDYYFRYDMSLQLYLVGESLMGWMAHDLMSCVDVLLSRPQIDSKRIILLGSVAGGGDPAAVTAALDERIACVVPFNFGGPQPEDRYPLPADAESSFNYAGSGSWESTRNLSRSAVDGFLPWVIVGSVAPRRLIHAHEFSWDRDHDPVWKRYQKIWRFYGDDVEQRLAFAHGRGTLTSKDPPGSHCNNIGAVHRRQIHEAFRKWFGIEVRPEDEYQNRRPQEELTCLTEKARQEIQPQALHKVLATMADDQLRAARAARAELRPQDRLKQIRESWSRLLGNVEPSKQVTVRAGSPHTEKIGEMTVTREIFETEPGIFVPVMTLSAPNLDELAAKGTVLGIAADGIQKFLLRERESMARGLTSNVTYILAEVRGTGESSPGSDRGQQSEATAQSATHLMLGQSVLGGQVRDLRAVWRHIRTRHPKVDHETSIVSGGSGASPLPVDLPFSYPRRINGRPPESDPTGALLAALVSLFEIDSESLLCNRGLVSYRDVLESPFVQIPQACIVPGLLREGDMADLFSVLAPRRIDVVDLSDGRGRLVPVLTATSEYEPVRRAYAEAEFPDQLRILLSDSLK